MKLIDAVKGMVQEFWHDNSRPSSNQKDVLKLRMGSRDREPHIKHFLDMAQTKLYKRFRHEHNELNLGQRSFEKCKPWYVKISTTRNTCCCRYHIEYAYYYDTYIYLYCVFFITLLCKNAQLHCHQHHLESLSIASCVEGHKVAHFIKGLA